MGKFYLTWKWVAVGDVHWWSVGYDGESFEEADRAAELAESEGFRAWVEEFVFEAKEAS